MKGLVRRFAVVLIAIGLPATPGFAAEPDGNVTDDVLKILRERGIIDQAEYQRLAAKNAKYEKKQESWTPKIEWSGDFRFRHESFFFDEDATGSERRDRFRIRYRLRLQGKIRVNEWADVIFRVDSGDEATRSRNQTLGSGPDFDTDDLRIDRAYAQLRAPREWVPLGGRAKVEMGKVPNPFHWKIGKDYLWDADINPEGVSLQYSVSATEASKVFANAGYYIIDENSSRNDPHVWALQLGGSHDASDDVTLGGRVGFYSFNSINSAFLGRGQSFGNTRPDGLTGEVNGGPARVIQTSGYVKYDGVQDWPMLLYGEFVKNVEAASTPVASEEDTAWSIAFEVGDKKKYVKLGFGWWHYEANAFPAQFVESDLFDRKTNREGPVFYASRRVMKNTDLNLTLFSSKEIDGGIIPASDSVSDADRVRIQADMVMKF
jgi:hypothetical protein